MTGMKYTRASFLGICAIAQVCTVRAAPPCAALGAADRNTLAGYVQKKYKLPSTADVDVREVSFVGDSCYRRLQFVSGNSTRPFNVELIASPDLRFLTREVFDSTADPLEEERREARALASKLAEGDAAALGLANAPVTMVLFSDFQCPFCSRMAHGLRQEILPREGDKVRLIFRNYPLPMHPWARAAAEAAACATVQGDNYFWPLHDYMFDHQRDFTADNLVPELSRQASLIGGFDPVRFANCIDRKETASSVDRDVAFGKQMKVSGTPTLFVNGQRVSGYQAEQIQTLIRELTQPTESPEIRKPPGAEPQVH